MSAILEPSAGETHESGSTIGSAGNSLPPDSPYQYSRGSKAPKTVMLSWSGTDEMDASLEELHRSVARLASDIISAGMDVACATNPRMFDLGAELSGTVAKYWMEPAVSMRFTNYLAWPVHAGMSTDEVRRYSSASQRGMRTILLDVDGMRMMPNERLAMSPRKPGERDWHLGLSAMRRAACMMADCVVAVDGRTGGYRGIMPGVAEEILYAISSDTPVILVGGFGGCARHIADTMGITGEPCGKNWDCIDEFSGLTFDDLNNCLSRGENARIACGKLDPDDRRSILQCITADC